MRFRRIKEQPSADESAATRAALLDQAAARREEVLVDNVSRYLQWVERVRSPAWAPPDTTQPFIAVRGARSVADDWVLVVGSLGLRVRDATAGLIALAKLYA